MGFFEDIFGEDDERPQTPQLQKLDIGAETKRAQDMAVDWSSRWSQQAPGMDKEQLKRIEELKSPEQKALEAKRYGIAGELMERGATGLMGDFMKYMRSQGMQVAASRGVEPAGGFGQSLASKWGAESLLGNQLRGAQLAEGILGYETQQQAMARQPANVLLQSGMPTVPGILQAAMMNNDLENQQRMLNYQVELDALGKGGSTAKGITGAIQGGLGGAMAGFMVGGPWGAVAGGAAGALGGGLAGGLGGSSGLANTSALGQSALGAASMFRGGLGSGRNLSGGFDSQVGAMNAAPYSSGASYNPNIGWTPMASRASGFQ